MKKLINKILFRLHQRSIAKLIAAFYNEDMQPLIRDAETLNRLTKSWSWPPGKVRRVRYLCMYFGFIERCKHPLFNKRIAYRLGKEMQ